MGGLEPLFQHAARQNAAAHDAQRAPLYARFADAVIDNNGTPEETVRKILEVLA